MDELDAQDKEKRKVNGGIWENKLHAGNVSKEKGKVDNGKKDGGCGKPEKEGERGQQIIGSKKKKKRGKENNADL